MSTLLRVDILIESLLLQLERGGMTYEEAVVTEDIVSDEAQAKVISLGGDFSNKLSRHQSLVAIALTNV